LQQVILFGALLQHKKGIVMIKNKRLKKRWIKALRSGEYKQARRSLLKIDNKGKESFCCLGVLCNEELDDDWVREGGNDYGFLRKQSEDVDSSELPEDFRIKIGLSDTDQRTLTQMNDGITDGISSINRHSFSSIADWIEKNL